MRRAEAGGQPSRLISEGAGCAHAWLAAAAALKGRPVESAVCSGVGVMRLASLPLTADSAGKPALLAADGGAAPGSGPIGSAVMRRGGLAGWAPLALPGPPEGAPTGSAVMRRTGLALAGGSG